MHATLFRFRFLRKYEKYESFCYQFTTTLFFYPEKFKHMSKFVVAKVSRQLQERMSEGTNVFCVCW